MRAHHIPLALTVVALSAFTFEPGHEDHGAVDSGKANVGSAYNCSTCVPDLLGQHYFELNCCVAGPDDCRKCTPGDDCHTGGESGACSSGHGQCGVEE